MFYHDLLLEIMVFLGLTPTLTPINSAVPDLPIEVVEHLDIQEVDQVVEEHEPLRGLDADLDPLLDSLTNQPSPTPSLSDDGDVGESSHMNTTGDDSVDTSFAAKSSEVTDVPRG